MVQPVDELISNKPTADKTIATLISSPAQKDLIGLLMAFLSQDDCKLAYALRLPEGKSDLRLIRGAAGAQHPLDHDSQGAVALRDRPPVVRVQWSVGGEKYGFFLDSYAGASRAAPSIQRLDMRPTERIRAPRIWRTVCRAGYCRVVPCPYRQ